MMTRVAVWMEALSRKQQKPPNVEATSPQPVVTVETGLQVTAG